jgi:ubiquinol-cytochrome c reductase cytochrome b subunit
MANKKAYKPIEKTDFGKKVSGPVEWMDDRMGLGASNKLMPLRKVFPEHWSFMLGEIALWSFIVLLLSGTFLTLWFQPSMAEVVYDGSYDPLRGLEMSKAFASTLDISFEIRGGLLMRQVHHWAAMLFVAAIVVHLLRIFFTGAYRKPREVNWLIGLGLFQFALIEGFAGYSLPDDLLSGTGLRFVDGLIRSIPLVGSYLEFFVFGGEFPGDLIIPRLYIAHVFIIPGLLLGLIAAHMMLLVYQKHTQWPGPGRTNDNVVGYPLLPQYAAKAGGFFFIVFGFTVLMSATFQINPIWAYGPYNPSEVTAGSQPDWYMGFVEGAVRIMPNWEFNALGFTWSMNVFIPAVMLLGALFAVLGAWPFVENWISGDKREHHLLQRPRDVPTRTAFGVAGIVMYAVFWIAGGNDIVAHKFHLSLNAITWFSRIAWIVLPIIAFYATRRICIGLQRADVDRVLHGIETGVIERSIEGGYSERHAPLEPGAQYSLTSRANRPAIEPPYKHDANGVRNKRYGMSKLRYRLAKFYYYGAVERPSEHDIEHAEEHFADFEGHPLELGEEFQGVSETGVPKSH